MTRTAASDQGAIPAASAPLTSWRVAYEAEAEKFQAETRRVSDMFDALDHWRFIAEQSGLEERVRQVIRSVVAEVRAAGGHVDPRAPGHDGGGCRHHWGSANVG